MSDEAMEHQGILVHKGQQMFICTEVGTYIWYIVFFKIHKNALQVWMVCNLK